MASNSAIGSVFVALGLDSAQFDAGLKRAQGGLASFGKLAATGVAAVAAAAVAAGSTMAVMGQSAINSADSMSKAAQKAGVATEALSRLNYAAGYSDVSLEQLTGGLQKLAKNMADVASGSKGPAATAFQALGISITDASGKLRDSDAVFADIADRFGRLEDGSTKTALAMQLFGKTGAELIPLLNSGRDGLKQMADESDRLGLTVSTKTGRAAEQFNDTMTKMGRVVDGVAMRIAEAALPALQGMADWIVGQSPQIVSWGTALLGAGAAITAIGVAATVAAPGLSLLAGSLSGVATAMGAIAAIPGGLALLAGGAYFASTTPVGAGEDAFVRAMRERWEALKGLRDNLANLKMPSASDLYAGFNFGADGKMNVQQPASLELPVFSDTTAADALASRLESLRQSLMTEEQLEMDSHLKRLEEIKKFYADGAIARGEYDSMLESAQQQHADRMSEIAKKQVEEETRLREGLVSNVASIFGSLSSLAESFGDQNLGIAKAFAVAEAIMNTAQGITKALAQGGIFGFAGAAAVAAAGAAQIATILSTSKGSSNKPSVRGGGGSTPVVAAPEAPAAADSRSINITFQGLGRSGMEQFVRELNEAIGDGVKLNLNPA